MQVHPGTCCQRRTALYTVVPREDRPHGWAALGAVAATRCPAGSGWTAPHQRTFRSLLKGQGFGPLGSRTAAQLWCVHGHVHLLYVLQRFHVRDFIPDLHPRATDDTALKGGVDDP